MFPHRDYFQGKTVIEQNKGNSWLKIEIVMAEVICMNQKFHWSARTVTNNLKITTAKNKQ